MTTTIPIFQKTDRPADIATAFDKAGCAVVQGMAEPTELEATRSELYRYMSATPVTEDDAGDFYPGKTRRITALMARSPACQQFAVNPLVNSICDHHLGGNCERFHLHVTAALEVGPGAREQVLHREEDPFSFFKPPRPNMIVATMWAISRFTKDNGGTLLVPGSHTWEADRVAEPNEVVAAEMPAGSVLFWAGGTLHGAGANITDEWRYGVILTYSLGWLRQEENQYLDLPEDLSREVPKAVRDLVGYPMHGSLGLYDPSLRMQYPE